MVFGIGQNSGGYSLPMIGTPCDVPLPRKMNENAMRKKSSVHGKYHTAGFGDENRIGKQISAEAQDKISDGSGRARFVMSMRMRT